MKQFLLSIAITSMVFLSCKKTDIDNQMASSLNGKWRMASVKDNASGFSTTKPPSVQGEVDITFTSVSATNGTFTGVTPTNDIWLNDFTIGANQAISIPSLGMTKVGETSWGKEFVNNICNSQKYNLDGNKLTIKTTSNTLTFQKL